MFWTPVLFKPEYILRPFNEFAGVFRGKRQVLEKAVPPLEGDVLKEVRKVEFQDSKCPAANMERFFGPYRYDIFPPDHECLEKEGKTAFEYDPVGVNTVFVAHALFCAPRSIQRLFRHCCQHRAGIISPWPADEKA